MTTRTVSIANLMGFLMNGRRPGEWEPPSGTAGVEICNPARTFVIACQHGEYRAKLEDHAYAANLFRAAHPVCRLVWLHMLWQPAAASGVAARRVTGTPDDAAQAALARVRSQGQEVEKFLALNQCLGCVAGLSELRRLEGHDSPTFALVHERGCPEWKAAA